MAKATYTTDFYENSKSHSEASASVVVPIVLELAPVKAVVDVGCGVGAWLAVFREHGVPDVVGLDGDHVDRRLLQIPEEKFTAVDLSLPFALPRTFDLAMSLEVAEHLPEHAAEGFVLSLTKLAPLVLFSAAIPFQEGTHHVNEQWPAFWVNLFKSFHYLPIDCIRPKIWANEKVASWYAQNTLLFASATRVQDDPILRREFEATNTQNLAVVHPDGYLRAARPGVGRAWRQLARALTSAAQWRIRRMLRRSEIAK